MNTGGVGEVKLLPDTTTATAAASTGRLLFTAYAAAAAPPMVWRPKSRAERREGLRPGPARGR